MKRLELKGHKINIEDTKAKIIGVLDGGKRAEKIALATDLANGDSKYSDRPVNRNYANDILRSILANHNAAKDNVNNWIAKADGLIESKKN